MRCGDHAFFDPETHLIMNHATGVCRLKFLLLTSTCIGAPASSGFGVMVEVHMDNSGMQLRFSIDEGVTYYNNKGPRITVPLDESSPQRTLASEPNLCGSCPTREADSLMNSTITWTGETDPFQTCYYKYGSDEKYCYSNSYGHGDSFYQCIPNDIENDVDKAWHAIDTMTKCETPCQNPFMKQMYWRMCPPVNSTDSFHRTKLANTSNTKKVPFQNCFQYKSEDKYCWTNSVHYPEFRGYFACYPVPEEGCGPDCEWWDSWFFVYPGDTNQCGEPCQHMYPHVF